MTNPQISNSMKFISGGARGSDTEWIKAARTFCPTVPCTVITTDDYDLYADKQTLEQLYLKCVARLQRRVLRVQYVSEQEIYSGKLVRRDMIQAIMADMIVCIGTLSKYKKWVEGGSAYACECGLILQKPVFVFDQNIGLWYRYNRGSNVVMDSAPKFEGNVALIGTREINSAGQKAIYDALQSNFPVGNFMVAGKRVKMYTSYWFNPAIFNHRSNSSDNLYIVQISLSVPEHSNLYGRINYDFKQCAPDWSTLKAYKEHKIDDGEYYAQYMRKLFDNKLLIRKIIADIYKKAKGKKIVFCCWEKPELFCHRHIFAEFANKQLSNLEITEL